MRMETTVIDGVVAFGWIVGGPGGSLETLIEGLQIFLAELFVNRAVGVSCSTTEGLALLGFVCFVSHYNYYGYSCCPIPSV